MVSGCTVHFIACYSFSGAWSHAEEIGTMRLKLLDAYVPFIALLENPEGTK